MAALTYEGLTKTQVTRGLSGGADDKCKCLAQIADYGQDAAFYLGYGPEVTRCLKDPSRDVKCAALKALGCMGAAGASDVDLVATYIKDGDSELKCAAVIALGGIGPYSRKYEQEVAELIKDGVPQIRAAAAKALGGMRAERQMGLLRKCFSDSDPKVAAGALRGIGLLGERGSEMASDVSACLANKDAGVRLAALDALTRFGTAGQKQAGLVTACLADDNNLVRHAAVSYFFEVPLGFVAYEEVGNIEKSLSNKDGRTQAAAAVALGNIQRNHSVLMKRLQAGTGDMPSKAKALSFDTSKLIALLDSTFEDEQVLALAAAGVEPKPSVELRRPACAAASTLGLLQCSDAAQPLASKACDTNSSKEVVASFLTSLGAMSDLPDAVSSKMPAFLNDASPLVRAGACSAWSTKENEADNVAAKMEDPHPFVRAAAALAIGKMGATSHSDEICKLLEDRCPGVQIAAMKALVSLGQKGEMYASEICKRALSGDNEVCLEATKALVSMGARGAAFAEEIASLLENPHSSIRKAALDALAQMGDAAKAYFENAQFLVNDPSEEVRFAAEAAVGALR